MPSARSGDLAHRVAHRRRELGLTFEQVAQRAGMDPGYVDLLERRSDIALTRGVFGRLAAALETTVAYLQGGEIDRPPGPGRAGPHPHLDILSKEECEAHLAGGGVGRFVFLAEQGPVALPVNFRLAGSDVVFRTRSKGALAAAAGTIVSFEADRIDEAMSEGWSVLVSGHAHLVDDPDELERIAALGIEPWPGGHRETVIRIETAQLSGRSIHQRESA